MADRPTGVTLIALLTGGYGLLWLVFWVLGMSSGNRTVLVGTAPVIGLVCIAVAAGLWELDPIAYVLALGLYGLSLVWTTIELMAGTVGWLPWIVGSAVVLYLLAHVGTFWRPGPAELPSA
ncbi:MAG: hypothetical protein ACLFMX_05430 [Halobacteriales archaeon]